MEGEICMKTAFQKEKWVKGMDTFLLEEKREKCEMKYSISKWSVLSIGRKYVTVGSCSHRIRFEYDEGKNEIWQEYDGFRNYEIYLSEEEAETAIKKHVLENSIKKIVADSIRNQNLTRFSVEELEFFKAVLDGMIGIHPENTLDHFLDTLPYEVKDRFYRKIWAKNVLEDIYGYAKAEGIFLSDKEAEYAAEQYVNGKYDCDCSYWTNISIIIAETLAESGNCDMEKLLKMLDYNPGTKREDK